MSRLVGAPELRATERQLVQRAVRAREQLEGAHRLVRGDVRQRQYCGAAVRVVHPRAVAVCVCAATSGVAAIRSAQPEAALHAQQLIHDAADREVGRIQRCVWRAARKRETAVSARARAKT